MDLRPFSLTRLPRVVFGDGSLDRLPELAASFGRRALLVTGRRSFRESPYWDRLTRGLERAGVAFVHQTVDGEPSPALVDGAVARFGSESIDVVVAIGGGSALDAGKAIAGLLPHGNSVLDHLEGVGRGVPYEGPSLPFIAAPTTAGTGSEATRNAVLSEVRRGGFKKSFRHEALVPLWAIVDPHLLDTCPPALIAADGMDALTQLVESYTSARAGPMTDALAWSGLEAAHDGLFAWYEGSDPRGGRSRMAYAALASGICLAQTGLGVVHGLASPLGAFFPIPHGVVCGTLLAAATAVNAQAMERREPHNPALRRYARLGGLLAGADPAEARAARAALVEKLEDWTRRLALPRLRAYDIAEADLESVVAASRGSSMKTNPIVLTDDEVASILHRRL